MKNQKPRIVIGDNLMRIVETQNAMNRFVLEVSDNDSLGNEIWTKVRCNSINYIGDMLLKELGKKI